MADRAGELIDIMIVPARRPSTAFRGLRLGILEQASKILSKFRHGEVAERLKAAVC